MRKRQYVAAIRVAVTADSVDMARVQKLKVFRTAIGFHDAYVAAPSQKAALDAWGSDADLFARGIAERVDDPALTEEPLANPGKVIKRARGTLAEQLAALPPDASKTPKNVRRGDDGDDENSDGRAAARSARRAKRKLAPPPKPRPSRSNLDQAERALVEAEDRQREERDQLDRRRRELDRETRDADRRHAAETRKLQDRVDARREGYDDAMRAWRG